MKNLYLIVPKFTLVFLVTTILGLSSLTVFSLEEKAPQDFSSKYFRNIEKTVLYLQPASWDDKEAIRCHGKEDLCADEYEARTPKYVKATSLTREEYIQKLKQDFLNYSVLFQSDFFLDFIKYFLSKNFNLTTEQLILKSEREAQEYLKSKNTLIVRIAHYKHTEIEPPITVLQVSFIRSDLVREVFPLNRAVPLSAGMSKEQIFEAVSHDLKGLSITVIPKL